MFKNVSIFAFFGILTFDHAPGESGESAHTFFPSSDHNYQVWQISAQPFKRRWHDRQAARADYNIPPVFFQKAWG